MTAQQTTPISQGFGTKRRRWFASRKLRYAALLLAVGVLGYFALPWLLMPADLRRMQGTWKVVRVVNDGNEEAKDAATFVFVGNRVNVINDTDKQVESYTIDCRPEPRELRIYKEEEITIFGTTVHVPVWLKPARISIDIHYEIVDARLTLRFDLGGTKREIFLERP